MNGFKKIDYKDINGYKILMFFFASFAATLSNAMEKKWPWLARRTLSINPEQMKWEEYPPSSQEQLKKKKKPSHCMISRDISTWFDSSMVKQLELIYAIPWIFHNG